MAARKPKIEYYWTQTLTARTKVWVPHVNWRLIGANGEIMCQSTQGFRDKADARRSVEAVTLLFCKPTYSDEGTVVYGFREVGPGRKPS